MSKGRRPLSQEEKLHTISVQVTLAEKVALEQFAETQERSVSYVARYAIRAMIEQIPTRQASAGQRELARRFAIRREQK